MNIITAKKLIHDFIKKDEEGNVEGSYRALNEVDLEVSEGSFIAVLGHNGSGKSTLARHINALLAPTGGSLWVGGFDTSDSDHIWDVRQTAGMIFQNPDNQIIGQIIEEDVAFGPENLGVPSDKIRERVEESLKQVGMYEYRGKSPDRLSGGQKQRVSIAGVIAMHPRCIVMDEPTAMLDPAGRTEVIAQVHRLNSEEGITVILITHYMEEVIGADRVFVMDHGSIALSGTPAEIFSHVEKLQELQLDVPQATLLAWKLRTAGLDIPENILTKEELGTALLRLKR